MTNDEIRTTVLNALGAIAPEADLAALDPDADMREALDLDSMDVLGFAAALDRELGVAIPEVDYGRVATLKGCTEYLAARLAPAPT